MKLSKALKRFFVPAFVVTGIYLLKYKCKVSPKAEVDLTKFLVIGKGTQISSFCKIKASDGPMTIGENVSIATGCFLSSSTGGVEIGDYCMISPNVTIVGNNYKYDKLDVPMCLQEQTSKGITIGRDVWIGAGAAILDGANIGDGVIITPNSVVSAKIPDNAIVQGNPGKVIFQRR
ncbi:MAG: acyltransferase [Gammaproteobacteria bacterium]|nr:acyltransferase [Gammaproteobacteria bacterium]